MSVVKRMLDFIHDANASRELKHVSKKIKTVAKGLDGTRLVDLVFEPPFNRFFWIKQVRSEINQLVHLVGKLKPKRILEIGTAQGGSLFLLTQNSATDATVISVDLPFGKFGGGYKSYRSVFYKSFAPSTGEIHLVRGDSHSKEVFQQVVTILNGGQLDFIFIDGDHTYEGVKEDFYLYKNLAAPNAVIALHDIAKHKDSSECKVHLFWEEIREQFYSIEWIEDPCQHWAGIGVVFLDRQIKDKL